MIILPRTYATVPIFSFYPVLTLRGVTLQLKFTHYIPFQATVPLQRNQKAKCA